MTNAPCTEHSQSQVYQSAVEDLVQKLFSAYGQTDSGKTHLMGTNFVDHENEDEKGIIPQAIQNIFNEVQNKSEEAKFSIKASFIELYQEQVYDLLSPNRATLDIREDSRGIRIPGLTEISVNDFSSTLQCLVQGSSGRATRVTAMNAQSSRSNCIFTLTINQMQDNGSKKTKATGERFKEGMNINKGLLSLGNVITSLCEKSAHISYRDSKLTRLLQDSLGGNSVTLMIVCISPANYNMDETVSTLRYANRALQIKNKPVVNQDPITAQISALSKENQDFKLKIVTMETDGFVCCPPEHITLQKTNKDLQEKMRAMSQILSEHKTLKLKIDFENALKCNNLEKLNYIKHKIDSFMDEHNRTEVVIIGDDYVTATEDMVEDDVSEPDNETDQTKEQMVLETIQLNSMKEHLAAKLIELVSHIIGKYCPEENSEELKNKLEQLKQERDQLEEEALKVVQTNNINSKLSEQRRKKLQELEQRILNLTKKCFQLDRIIKIKAKNDVKVENLNNEIKSIKVMKVKLIQQMKSENEKFRQLKLERDRELCRLHARQQAALKQKLEEAANVNKRLKNALAVRKAIEVKRDEAFMPKAQHIQKWVNEELDVLMKIDREPIYKMIQRCEEQLETTGLADEYGLEMDKNEITEELQLRTAQITDLRQKIFDSNEELIKKNRFDHLTTIADTKTALKYVFHVAADNRRAMLELQNQIEELKVLQLQYLDVGIGATDSYIFNIKKKINNNSKKDKEQNQTCKIYNEDGEPSDKSKTTSYRITIETDDIIFINAFNSNLLNSSNLGNDSFSRLDIGNFVNLPCTIVIDEKTKHELLTNIWTPEIKYSFKEDSTTVARCFRGHGNSYKQIQFVKNPCIKYKDFHKKACEHKVSKTHLQCTENAVNFIKVFSNKATTVFDKINTSHKLLIDNNRKKNFPIISSILFCGTQEIALRGKTSNH
ncbi:hypothetical protein QTP88_027113 [Uroleucon formosanum]